jgi:hypothetical protein
VCCGGEANPGVIGALEESVLQEERGAVGQKTIALHLSETDTTSLLTTLFSQGRTKTKTKREADAGVSKNQNQNKCNQSK